MINEVISIQDEVKLSDIGGQEYIVLRTYCNITRGKSYSMICDILDENLYNNNKAMCLQKYQEFKAICEQRAVECGVEIF